jgi:hypothetical protein
MQNEKQEGIVFQYSTGGELSAPTFTRIVQGAHKWFDSFIAA